ncbi:ABC transporter ATP-binding protein [Shewanella profunda]|uniref:ABC transporter ATP-binding protein n=1 Tax=Shewanella profunda TaxID=254793 RepID=UPI00200BE214|nr:ABC transporter ATP-binding protein [Shewanella profunda]MCL1089222.1 ABC transporter ATP-binding protein [Shewanella profunda]
MNHQALTPRVTDPLSNVEVAVRAKDISKDYGKFKALTDINFDVLRGQTLALLGHNGAGKSTLLKLILGLITPSKGQIQVQGQDVRAMNVSQSLSIGYLPENVSFYDNMTALELLDYFAKLKGVTKGKVHTLLSEFGLEAAKDKRLGTFSKGMRQRLGLAQAILAEPKVLLLDEPTVGLDPLASAFLYQKMAQLKAQGCAIIISTHELGLVQENMDRALILGRGHMIASGNLTSLREATALPAYITLHAISNAQRQQVLVDPILASYIGSSTPQGIRLSVPVTQKSVVLTLLLQKLKLEAFSVESPSLQDIFHYYMDKVDAPSSHTLSTDISQGTDIIKELAQQAKREWVA